MIKLKHIVLAEDDLDDRELFVEAISIVDPEVLVATVENGEKLMDYLTHCDEPPDCIFLDLNMPRKGGKECLGEIRQNEKTKQVPVIIYTTSLSTKDIDETFHRGASCFIRKPSTFRELTELLKKYLTTAISNSNLQRIKMDFVLNPR